jgi:para-aminobenzoate synthetase component 1
MPSSISLPVVRPLPEGFSIVDAFKKLSPRHGCLWLDSSSPGPPAATSIGELGRYSFLTADPLESLSVSLDQPDPWPILQRWCRELPCDFDPDLPPFQGGIAGLIGYEAGSWLEPVGVARLNDLPTPAMSLGIYDWTIAVDHSLDRAWLISQGLGSHEPGSHEPGSHDPQQRLQIAHQRADDVLAWISHASRSEHRDTRLPKTHAPPASSDADGPDVISNFTSDQFRSIVTEVVRRIHAGDSFQVNLAQRLLKKARLPAAETYLRLRASNPAPFSAYYGGDGFAVLSSSPEEFLKVRGRKIETRPIKGTTSRSGEDREDLRLAEALFASEKDRAENIMIVDLMRNDLSRVCQDDSVVARQLCEVESYQYVQHLVSVVQGRLRDDATVVDSLRACFPGGSVTGAPKIEAMRTIAALEPNHRGPYCGSIGYISCGGNADFNILIRTITAAHGYWQIPVGGGITARSDPAAEEAETWAKAKGMLKAIASDD